MTVQTITGLLVLCLTITAYAANKPNIIVIMADDLGYYDVGFQGSQEIKTPHLDNLAAGGVRFTDAHVSASVCSPSRAGFMTGRYQQRFGHEGNCPRRPDGMDPKERTLGQAMRDCGYKTAIFGKWHLGDETHQHPNVRGFDEFWGLREGSRSFWFNKKEMKADNPKGIEHNGTQVSFEGHLTDRLGDQAIQYIETNKRSPFFIFLSFTAPHGPLESKKEDMAALGTTDNYAGLIYGMDRNIGRVMETLDKHKLRSNTMIWFLSDNGGTVKQACNHPLGGKKGTKFEGGHRVPFILYWEGHIPSGKVYQNMVSSLDIYPTCVAAAGGSLTQERPIDGVDLMPFITGTKNSTPHAQLYWRKLECAAMRDGRWKLIRVANLGYALYDVDADIGEKNNLAKQMPEKLEALKKKLEAWEQDKMTPLWGEGAKWIAVRYNDHKSVFETGDLPKNSMVRTLKK